ncbi:MAG TPA: laccase domain-containing protein, partial [Acidobacteriota bacterium]
FGEPVVVHSAGKPRLDLIQVAILQLLESGVEEMEAAHLCTACHPDLFFSYRRDGSSGRMMSFIGLI